MKLNKSIPLTFQDTGTVEIAVQQGKAVGMVAKTVATKLIHDSQRHGVERRMIPEPMLLEPICVGVKKGEPALLAKVNAILVQMDKSGEINTIWNKWLGPKTQYRMVRHDRVIPLKDLKFVPVP